MSKTDSSANAPSFKARYKLQGILTAVASLWISYAMIHNGLTSADPSVLSGGLAAAVVAAAVAYYFG
ncbi:MAG: hypothetical protein O2930_15485 [Acidobacteria bacterium]|nr:hypothetical protein [Acidobacteriota bacterium]